MIGQPRFKREDQVAFKHPVNEEERIIEGVVYIVDAFGTFEQKEEPSYDIMAFVDGEKILFKHVRESLVSER